MNNRSPQAFVLPDEDEVKTKTKKAKASPKLVFEPELEHTDIVVVPHSSDIKTPRRFRWAGLMLSALFTLFTLWAGLTTVELIESFFARHAILGWLALGIAAVAGLAALAIIVREVLGLMQLRKIEKLQEHAARAINLDEQSSADIAVRELQDMYHGRADVAWGLQQFASHKSDILDPKDRLNLADRLLLQPLDEAAHKIIARRARRNNFMQIGRAHV
jgi:putative membrane protein